MGEAIIKGHRTNVLISELQFIAEAIDCYHQGKFIEMKNLILEYGAQKFFTDLFQYLESNEWRSERNRYLTFTGITIQYFKIYT